MERLHYIDNLKMTAIVCVVIGHICAITHTNWMIDIIYSFHMALFFAISSYTVALLKKSIILTQKAKQLIIPYISICIIAIIAKGFSKESILGYLFSETRWGYWFLPTLFLLFILMKIFLFLLNTNYSTYSKYFLFLYILLIEGILISLKLYLPPYLIELLCIRHLVTYWPFFIFGYFYNNLLLLHSKNATIIAILLWFLILIMAIEYNISNEATRTIGRFAAITCLLNIYKSILNITIPYLTNIGKKTLSIYLFHYFFLPSVTIFFSNQYNKPFLSLGIGLLIVGICCFIHDQIIQKITFLQFIFTGKNNKYKTK